MIAIFRSWVGTLGDKFEFGVQHGYNYSIITRKN